MISVFPFTGRSATSWARRLGIRSATSAALDRLRGRERTLQGFETFLDQDRAPLASMPSGVTYVASSVWDGAIQQAFTKAFTSHDRGRMDRFTAYCGVRSTVGDTQRHVSLTPEQHQRFRDQCKEFLTPAFDALYRKYLETGPLER